jgi:hypothetical protein
MYNKDKIFQMTGLSESEFYKKYPTKAHFEKEHGADIFDKGGFIQDDSAKKQQKAFNKAEQMYDDSLALFNSANIDNQWMANIDKTKVSRKDYKAQMQIQDRDALQEAYDRLLRTNNQAPEISSDTLNVLRSDNPKATKELILMNQYKKPTNPPLNPKNFPTKKERDAMDLKQMQLNQQFAEGGLMEDPKLKLTNKQVLEYAKLLKSPTYMKDFNKLSDADKKRVINIYDRTAEVPFNKIPFNSLATKNSKDSADYLSSYENGLKLGNEYPKGVKTMLDQQLENPKDPNYTGRSDGYFDKVNMKKFANGGLMQNNPQLQEVLKGLRTTAGGAIGGAGAGLGMGATIGGILGTVVPGVGNAVGAAAGATLGTLGGGLLGGLGGATKSFFGDGGQLTEINAGGTHEANSNGGVPVMEGKLVEENETIFDSDKGKYVFSDRITKGKKSFADLSKEIEKKYSKRTGDKLAETARKRELSTLMLQQEALKANEAQNNKMAEGGFLSGLNLNKILENLGLLKVNQKSLENALKFKTDFSNDQNNTTLDQDIAGGVVQDGNKNSKLNNEVLYDLKAPNLDYLPQTAGSLFNIAKGIGSNKQINYKGITPRLINNNYNLTSSLTNLNSDSAGVNTDIRTNSNLTLAQKISALGSVAANTQKAKADMINQSNFANMGANNNLINSAKQYNAGVFDRNIDANEMYQDKRAEAIKTGLDTLGTGSSTYIKDKKANKYENANNKMLADLFKELYPEATKRAKYKFEE